MIITDTTTVNKTLNTILDSNSMISIDMTDVNRLFGDNPTLRMLKVAGDTVEDVVNKLKAELCELGGCPEKYVAAYVSTSLRMSDLETLGEATASAQRYKATFIHETDPEGKIAVYLFLPPETIINSGMNVSHK